MKQFLTPLFLILITTAQAQIPCKGGSADGYDCYGVDLMSRVDVLTLGAEEHEGVWVSDIWGWTDPETGKEYALVGMTNGTSFVDVSDPVNPIVLGVLKEHNWDQKVKTRDRPNETYRLLHDGAKSVWRDIKVYQNYAYIVSEDSNHGIQVFDLTDLRDVTELPYDFQESGHYDGVGQAHNVFINEETGFLYAVGFTESGTCSSGGLHMVDLSDPVNPTYAGCYDSDGYTHDTQCVIYNGPDEAYQGKEICFSSNEDTITLTDVTSKSSPQMISKKSYTGAEYVHQGWLTEDQRYFLSNDELDEYFNGGNTRTFIWDLEYLDDPQMIGIYTHSTVAIDHNLYIKGNRAFESNYTSGLRILNLSDIKNGNLKEDLFFDTYKFNNAASFYGTWSNYPYFESGNIIVSDITNGLFVLRPLTVIFDEQPKDHYGCVGDHIDIPIVINGDNLSYQWQINEGDGFENVTDFERYHSANTDSLHAHMVIAEQNGTQFRCIVTDEFGEEFISEPMTLFVEPEPIAAFDFEDNLGTVSFTNSSENATSFEWIFGDGATSTEENPQHSYTSYEVFEVKLIASNGCGTDTFIQNVDRFILGTATAPYLEVYPNPVQDQLVIKLPEGSDKGVISITGIDGRIVLKSSLESGDNVINVSRLKSGIYILNALLDQKVVTRKVYIE